jgi:hypothetical protein
LIQIWSKICIDLRVKYPLFPPDWMNIEVSQHFFFRRNTQISNFMKIRPVRAEMLHAFSTILRTRLSTVGNTSGQIYVRRLSAFSFIPYTWDQRFVLIPHRHFIAVMPPFHTVLQISLVRSLTSHCVQSASDILLTASLFLAYVGLFLAL